MFGFLYGLDGSQIQELLTGLVSRWADIIDDQNNPSTGITPRLFVAAVMSQYGAVVAAKIKDVYTELLVCDGVLQKAILAPGQEQETALSTNQLDLTDANTQIQLINDKLIDLNRQLTGTRSTMHYLAESADTMVKYITNFEEYVEARLDEWHTTSEKATREPSGIERAPTFNISLKSALKELDSFRERTRDHDKLVIVRKNMFQYKTYIKSLQQHININVGMVSAASVILRCGLE